MKANHALTTTKTDAGRLCPIAAAPEPDESPGQCAQSPVCAYLLDELPFIRAVTSNLIPPIRASTERVYDFCSTPGTGYRRGCRSLPLRGVIRDGRRPDRGQSITLPGRYAPKPYLISPKGLRQKCRTYSSKMGKVKGFTRMTLLDRAVLDNRCGYFPGNKPRASVGEKSSLCRQLPTHSARISRRHGRMFL